MIGYLYLLKKTIIPPTFITPSPQKKYDDWENENDWLI